MTFENIMMIDREPFDADVVEMLCDPEKPMRFVLANILTFLIKRYFVLFSERHSLGFDITEDRWIVTKTFVDDDAFELEWYSGGYELCATAMETLGWEVLVIDQKEEECDCEGDVNKEREWASARLTQWIKSHGSCRTDEEMVIREREIWLNMTKYLEYGYCFFFWNDKLSWYLEWREANPGLVDKICRKEDAEIHDLLQSIWYPFLFSNEARRGCAYGRYYGCESMGSNGELTVDYDSFDPNWVSRAFVLDCLLDCVISKTGDIVKENKAA